ncbi:MAG: helix-turn-helix domain-containing protein [Candidatus Eisenbacteria bacterium]|nr:helix-turn-helix domain-containing protein [Candidatus Eisenbacteria bacterium]
MRDWATRLGKAVRLHRKAARITQHELGRLSGVGKSAVYDIERGKPTVRLETLLRVLRTLNIRLEWSGPLAGSQEDPTGEGDTSATPGKEEEKDHA